MHFYVRPTKVINHQIFFVTIIVYENWNNNDGFNDALINSNLNISNGYEIASIKHLNR